jgi:hypothetical protein
MKQLTSVSGRLFQPSAPSAGCWRRRGTAPFRLVQRRLPRSGTGLVARGRRPGPLDAAPAHRGAGPADRLAASALHVGLLLTFAFLYPPFTGFDETQHVDAVLSIRHGDGWPAPQERELSEGIVAVATPALRAASDLPFSDDELPPRDERPSIAELGVERDSVGQLLPNQITQHPPLYYALQAGVLAVLPGSADWPYDATVGVLRLVSVLLMAPLPLLAWATARALRAPPSSGTSRCCCRCRSRSCSGSGRA